MSWSITSPSGDSQLADRSDPRDGELLEGARNLNREARMSARNLRRYLLLSRTRPVAVYLRKLGTVRVVSVGSFREID